MSSEKLGDKVEQEEKLKKAKELYSTGSRSFLVRNYSEAADDLSEVCRLFEEIYGELSDELGMPYLLYAKSLISLALDENKVIDVPDEEFNEDEESDDDLEQESQPETSKLQQTNGKHLECIEENSNESSEEVDSTEKAVEKESNQSREAFGNFVRNGSEKCDAFVSSTDDSSSKAESKSDTKWCTENKDKTQTSANPSSELSDEKPSTSNCDKTKNTVLEDTEDENEVASNLQLAWEILELAAKIFARQGMSGLPNLADVQTELGNIEFENNILEAAREDYEKALNIYKQLNGNYRRAMAEIYYKIGLTFLMQQMNQEGADSLKEAANLLEAEINELNSKENVTDKDEHIIQDMEETKQEILAKIKEIEETKQQNIAEVRAALDKFISPDKTQTKSSNETDSATSTVDKDTSPSSAISSSTSKPTDISHLIKRKKPDSPLSSEAEAVESRSKKRPYFKIV